MAQMRTLKGGRLYLLKDGSAFDDIASAAPNSAGWFQKSDGTWGALVEQAGDLYPYSGGTPASLQQASPSAVINDTNESPKPTFYTGSDGRIHCWYATDESGTNDYDLRYTYSTNDGTSWATSVDLNIRGDQTWCTTAIWPLYFEYQGLSATVSRLWCLGSNAGTITVGYVNVVHAGTFNTDVANVASYVANTSSSASVLSGQYAAMTKNKGLFYLFSGNSGTPTVIQLRTSLDGTSWSPACDVLVRGNTGASDDVRVDAFSAVFHRGVCHLLYMGDSSRVLLAVGESPERLTKVPMVDTALFTSTVSELADYSADLSFTMPDLAIHIPNRNKPGALRDGAFQPMDLTFTMRQVGALDATDTALGYLLNGVSPAPGTDSVNTNQITRLGRVNVCYVMEGDDGNPAEYYLFPDCQVASVQVQEGIEGNTINATLRCHSMQRPLFGSIE